jgi:phage head maturation protease
MTATQIALDREIEQFYRDRYSAGLLGGALVKKGIKIDEEKRTIDGVISTEAIDRDNEVVVARGLDLTDYHKNPVVLFMHDPYCVIGKCNDGPKLRKRGGMTEMVATTKFAETDLANEVFELAKGEFLRGISIGMAPYSVDRSPPEPKEIRKRPELASVRYMIRKAELAEFSFVTVPANPDALTTAVGKGFIKRTEPYFERFIRVVKDAEPKRSVIVVPQCVPEVISEPPVKVTPRRVVVLKDVRVKRALAAGRL